VSAIQIVSVTEGGLAPLWTRCRTYPSKKALASIVGRVRALTRRLSHPTLAALLRQLNLVLRDWCTYFGHGVSKATFGYLDQTGSCCSNRYSWRAGCVETRVSGSEGGLNVTLVKASTRPSPTHLIDTEHQRLVRRVPDTADDIAHLADELRVVADLEGVYQMRFEPERHPDPPHRGLREPGFFGHRRARPVRGISGRALQRRDGHRLELLIGDRAAHHGGDGR
jgi:hypothetical protein